MVPEAKYQIQVKRHLKVVSNPESKSFSIGAEFMF